MGKPFDFSVSDLSTTPVGQEPATQMDPEETSDLEPLE